MTPARSPFRETLWSRSNRRACGDVRRHSGARRTGEGGVQLLVLAQVLVVESTAKTIHLLFRFVYGDAVLLLYLADELIALARDDIEVVVGQLAPLLLRLAFHLLPV